MEISNSLQNIELDFIKYRVLFLKLQNKSMYEILQDKELKKFNLSKELITEILDESKNWFKKDSDLLEEFTKIRELMKTELIEKEAWETFNKSKEGTIEIIESQSEKMGFQTTTKTKNNSVNIKALEIILDCVKERNRVLGNIAPVKSEHSGAIELRELQINYISPIDNTDED